MNYLLQISIGPVQDFISAARRTRDLWFGSNLLGEIAKAVAESVQDDGGKLIFPAAANKTELEELKGIANIILAEFYNVDSTKLKSISDKANVAAKDKLKDYADKVFARTQYIVVKDRYYSQIDDVIEFYSAWVPVDSDYASARKQVARLLAARKNIRDFMPSQFADRVPKSSLDGLRESVLIRNLSEKDLKGLPEDIKIKPHESLDAIGLIKRVPIDNTRFPSVGRVALNTWERGKGKKFINDFKRLNLLDDDELDSISWYLGDMYTPDAPYVAFICADGDKMGAALSRMTEADQHRKFSKELAGFAEKARDKIEEYNGSCIYTGGDDVLAFVPLDKAMECSRSIHDLFGEIMGKYEASLSVGVSIAHAKEDLGQLLQFGRDAERIAKNPDRNGLAVSVRSRGNIPFTVREQWKKKSAYEELDLTSIENLADLSLDERLECLAKCFMKNEIPAKFPYELRENAKFYDKWDNQETLEGAVISDVLRIFKRKVKRKDITLNDSEKGKISGYIKAKVKSADTIREFADELILAQWIGASMPTIEEGDENEIQNNAD